VSVRIDPDEPDCVDDDGHDWRTPHSVVGGLKENPGVWGNAGGVITREVCARCGAYLINNTWDQSQGPEPVETVRYEPADDASRAYVAAKRASDDMLKLIADHGTDAINAMLREHEDDPHAYVDKIDGEVWANGRWHRGAELASLVTSIDPPRTADRPSAGS